MFRPRHPHLCCLIGAMLACTAAGCWPRRCTRPIRSRPWTIFRAVPGAAARYGTANAGTARAIPPDGPGEPACRGGNGPAAQGPAAGMETPAAGMGYAGTPAEIRGQTRRRLEEADRREQERQETFQRQQAKMQERTTRENFRKAPWQLERVIFGFGGTKSDWSLNHDDGTSHMTGVKTIHERSKFNFLPPGGGLWNNNSTRYEHRIEVMVPSHDPFNP